MRKLEHAIADARALIRRAHARRGVTDPARLEPARLVVRLDDADLPGSLGEGDALTLAEWRQLLTSAIAWLGPTPVTVLAHHRADHPWLAEIIRFAHRLECDTQLVCDGTHIDRLWAVELLDCGLGSARILVGGVSDRVHREVVGNALDDASGAVEALLHGRADRGVALDVEVGVPWQGSVHTEARAIVGWARERGVDGFRILAPWRARDLPSDPELLDALGAEPAPFNRTPRGTIDELHAMVASQDGEPGVARASGFRGRRFRCPVGGQRLEISETGRVSSCPFKEPIATSSEDLRQTWGEAGPHLAAIASCARACVHPELAPARLLG